MCARFGWGVLGALATVAVASCSEPAAPRRPVILTTSDLMALSLQAAPPRAIVEGYGLPEGMRLDHIIKKADVPTLVKRDTFTEGYLSGYVTTEVWAGFDEVWIQPAYVGVTGYAPNGTPLRAKASGAWRPIFGVGADSAFYSPYWRTVYFNVGGQPLESFRSVRDVLSRGSDFRAAEGHVMVLAPSGVGVPERVIDRALGLPLTGGPDRGTGVLDGEETPFLDFGPGTFTWNDELVVEEAPIFVWVVRDENGDLRQLDLPTVAGTGPLYANRPAKVVGVRPKYGSYWRIYTVELPKDAHVFAPQPYTDLRDGLDVLGLSDLYKAPYDPMLDDVANGPTYKPFAGRVLMTPDCVKDHVKVDPTNFKEEERAQACQYLDSQPAIEAAVPSDAIKRTDILVTCPFITYREEPVLPEQPVLPPTP